MCLRHFAEEEAEAMPLMRRHFTPEEISKHVVAKVRPRSLQPSSALSNFPFGQPPRVHQCLVEAARSTSAPPTHLLCNTSSLPGAKGLPRLPRTLPCRSPARWTPPAWESCCAR